MMNVVVLQGTLSSEPVERTLPSGANVMDWQVTTEVEGVKLSVPVTWDDPPRRALQIDTGDSVVVLGTVRRRFFTAGGVTQSRTEVVARRMATPRQRATLAKLLVEAQEELAA